MTRELAICPNGRPGGKGEEVRTRFPTRTIVVVSHFQISDFQVQSGCATPKTSQRRTGPKYRESNE